MWISKRNHFKQGYVTSFEFRNIDLSRVISVISHYIIDDTTVILCLAITFIVIARLLHKKSNHRWRIKTSKRLITKLLAFDNPSAQFAYLRKIDPYVFEELILSSLQRAGISVARGTRYSGDQGIDGSFFFGGQRYLVQAKRYKSHINHNHVKDFDNVCHRKNVFGVFVHTGRTGGSAKSIANASNRIAIIGGQHMLDLISGDTKKIVSLLKQSKFANN